MLHRLITKYQNFSELSSQISNILIVETHVGKTPLIFIETYRNLLKFIVTINFYKFRDAKENLESDFGGANINKFRGVYN
jgi:hypothetical protein